jgi:hypothetical protein
MQSNKPVTRSFGTEEGRILVVVRAVVDIVVEDTGGIR